MSIGKKFFITIYSLIGFLSCIILLHDCSPYVASTIFCVLHLYSIGNVWVFSDQKISIYLLFLVSFGLFIGGRFFAVFLGEDSDKLWAPTFFGDTNLVPEDTTRILLFIMCFMIFSSLGFALSQTKNKLSSLNSLENLENNQVSMDSILNKMFYPLLFLAISLQAASLKKVIAGGYLSLYISQQTNEYSWGGASLLRYFLFAFLGLAIGYGSKLNRKKYIVLFIIYSILAIITGGRALMGGVLLFLIFYFYYGKKINLFKIAIVISIMAAILLSLSALSIREHAMFELSSIKDIFLKFLYDQGSTLIVFGDSTTISYTILHLLGDFIPGAALLLSFFSNQELFAYDLFGHAFLSYNIDSNLYHSGFGLGWSVLSDIYLFSFGNLFCFTILSLTWGYVWGKLEVNSYRNSFTKAFLYSVSISFLLLPRSSLGGLFRTSLIFVFCYCVCRRFSSVSTSTRYLNNKKDFLIK